MRSGNPLETRQNNRRLFNLTSVRVVFYLTIFILCFCLYRRYSVYNYDLYTHLYIAEQIANGHILVPHFFYHVLVYGLSKALFISYLNASCLVLAGSITASLVIVEHILDRLLQDRYSGYFLLLAAFALSLVSSIYLPFVNIHPYLGTWSPNPWHNPTYLAARPFVLLAFYWYSLETIQGLYFKKPLSLIRISILLVICAMIKPNFILAFIPASILFQSLFSDKKMEMLFKTAFLLFPVLGVLLLQYLMTYSNNDTGGSVRFCCFDIWLLYTQSVPLTLLRGLAFPLAVLAILCFRLLKDKPFLFSWMLLIVGLAIAGFLCETGRRTTHANFIWTYMFCLNIVFIYSAVAFLRWVSNGHEKTGGFYVKFMLCIVAFSLHLLSGIYYLGYLSFGHSY